jgi:hypothetical protein
MEHHMTFMEPLCSKLLLHEEEGWETQTGTGLSTTKQMDQEKLKRIAPYPLGYQLAGWVYPFHEI